MAKKKADSDADEAAVELNAPVDQAPVKQKYHGFVLKKGDLYVGRDGQWKLDIAQALHFLELPDAEGYLTLHFRDPTIEIVQGA